MGVYSTSGSGVDCTSQKEQIKMVWAAPRISTLEIHRTLGGGDLIQIVMVDHIRVSC